MAKNREDRTEAWRRYLEDSAQRLSEMDRLLSALLGNRSFHRGLEEIQAGFHDFAGSGALYALPEVSALGGEGEYMCYTVALSDRPPTDEELEQIAGLVRRLRVIFQGVMDTRPRAPGGYADRTVPLLLLVAPSTPESGALSEFLAKRGLQVERAESALAGLEKARSSLPDMAAVAVSLPDGSGYDFVRRFREIEGERNVPIVLLGAPELFHDKVEAIACGADGFLPPPVDPGSLFRKFRTLLGRRRASAARILAVEDDPHQAEFLERTLSQGGYQVRVLTDPMAFEKELHAFRPDLVLMDVLLPGVSGYDLVRYLRQEEGFSAVPVVFLTTEGRRKAQIKGAEAGGDDYLIKPVTPEDLLTTVKSRLIRYRSLQEMMDHDELTGLLAHTPFLQQARLCLSRFSRRQIPYAMVLVEVDPPKALPFPPPRVQAALLQGLARYLQRKVRQTDIMGRYGENLLALVLEHLTPGDAVKLLERLLMEYSQIEWPVEELKLRTTFTAGAAMAHPSMKTLKAWLDAASTALATARKQGGGRVALAPPP